MILGIFTDPHYALADRLEKSRRPALSLEKLREACRAFEENHIDALVCLGDWISVYGTEAEMTERLREMAAVARSLNVPIFTCMGNHDREIFTREQFAAITGAQVAPCMYEDEKSRLILLDANYKRDGSPWPEKYTDWTQTCVPEDQVSRLREELRCEKHCLVAMHQAVAPTIQFQHVIENSEEIRGIVSDSGNVDLVLSGHYHWGGDYSENGVRYLTLKAMCEEEENSFYIIDTARMAYL